MQHPNNVKIIADTQNYETGDRLTSFLIEQFPKPLLAQLNTHRVFSRNAASSRAIPVEKMIKNVMDYPFIPSWTSAQRGMQGGDKLTASQKVRLTELSLELLNTVRNYCSLMLEEGAHKQEVNRYLEPWAYVPVLITATDWANFFALRAHHTTQPDFCNIATAMMRLHQNNVPTVKRPGEWHIVFPDLSSELAFPERLKISTARAARLSYLNHYGAIDFQKDFQLHDMLLNEGHMSPFEHCARVESEQKRIRNFTGFMQYRHFVELGIPVC